MTQGLPALDCKNVPRAGSPKYKYVEGTLGLPALSYHIVTRADSPGNIFELGAGHPWSRKVQKAGCLHYRNVAKGYQPLVTVLYRWLIALGPLGWQPLVKKSTLGGMPLLQKCT